MGEAFGVAEIPSHGLRHEEVPRGRGPIGVDGTDRDISFLVPCLPTSGEMPSEWILPSASALLLLLRSKTFFPPLVDSNSEVLGLREVRALGLLSCDKGRNANAKIQQNGTNRYHIYDRLIAGLFLFRHTETCKKSPVLLLIYSDPF